MREIKKIIVVGPALKMGGMERATANIANGFAAQGFDVTLITIFEQPIFFSLDSSIKLISPKEFNTKRLDIRRTTAYLRTNILRERPHIVLVYNKFYAAITLIALWAHRSIPVYISERSSPLFHWRWHLQLFNFVAFKLRPPQGIIAQTAIAAQHQVKYYSSKIPIQVIPNSVRVVRRFPFIKREKIVLAVGRLNDHLKGFDRLLKAFALVKSKGWRLVLAGGTKDQDKELSTLIDELQLLPYTTFLGKVEDIDSLYAKASIFVMPSRSEGFPNALCEAMAAGVACISFDFVAGPQEIITNGHNGLLIPDGDIENLAYAMSNLMDNEALRTKLSENALTISNLLAASSIVEKHISFFANVSRR